MVIFCYLFLLIAAQQTVRYDKLTLLDGRVITGQIEQEDDDYLMIRVIKTAGKINYVRRVAKEHIAKREFVELPQRPEPFMPEVAEVPGQHSHDSIDDKVAYLQSIFDEWQIRNVEEAAKRLLKMINQSSAEELEHLDDLARRRMGATLAEFTARVNLEHALSRSEHGFFRLYFLTHYTLKETHTLLSKSFREAMTAKIVCPGHGAVRKRCQRVDSIAQWLVQPAQYNGDAIHAAEFSKHVTRTMGMGRELVRLCQALKRDRQEIIDLNAQRRQLRELLAVVNKRNS